MDPSQMQKMNQVQLHNIGNTIIQGGLPKSSHGDVYAVRQNRYRDELDKQVQMKSALKTRDRMNEWAQDNMHLDTISYAPVGNPAVSSRRSNRGHFQTSYNNQYIDHKHTEQQQKLQNSQSVPVSQFGTYFYRCYQELVLSLEPTPLSSCLPWAGCR